MAAHVIVLANRTAAAPELIEALVHRGEHGPIHATLVMPASGPGEAARTECRERLDKALEAWRAAGIEHCEGVVGDPIPHEALSEVWDPMRHDEVIVSTLPGQSSKWIRSDLRHAIANDELLRQPQPRVMLVILLREEHRRARDRTNLEDGCGVLALRVNTRKGSWPSGPAFP